jgi:glycosyltransferase involved in cell wall biosynthesis
MCESMSMKIAIFDHCINHGGGSRYLRCLLPALKEARPSWEIVFFSDAKAIFRDGLKKEFEEVGIECQSLASLKLENSWIFSLIPKGRSVLYLLRKKCKRFISFLPLYISGAVEKEIERKSNSFDLVFCSWPYFLKCPKIKTPLFAIFHDFNFRYYFSGNTFDPIHYHAMMEEIPPWIRSSVPLVSSAFMKSELEKFYPEEKGRVKVIPLSSLGARSVIDITLARKIVLELQISSPYILFPTNVSSHKNTGALLAAFEKLKKEFPNLILVFAGYGTEVINGRIGILGLERDPVHRDVLGLGYVSNEVIDALISCAEVVVSTSFYEAGCGPGLDAWARGTPVAMSNIPPYLEHLEFLGVRAKTFDPRSPKDIAEKIAEILNNPVEAKEDALYSKRQIELYGWNCVADQYASIFEETICQ